ncbi:MAG: DUF3999 domain-containing protein [Deltaproteobacteria bacterium]|nr:DUF3999 domain-containing protein [Deltaproteobacteria bacterium]
MALVLALAAEDAYAASLSEQRGERRAMRNDAKMRVAEAPLAVGSFKHMMVLDGPAGAVLSFTLPESVYKGLELAAFQDLCVFDADGTPVPFELRAPQGTNQRLEVEAELPYFLWQPDKAETRTPGSMDVEINTSGGIVRVKGQTGDPARSGVVSCLLDLQTFFDAASSSVSRAGQAFSAADLRERTIRVLMGGDQPFMIPVTMKTSADLDSWISIGKAQMLVRTRQGEVSLERDSLSLPETAQRYLLLQFAESAVPFSSFSAKAVFDKTVHEIRESIAPGALSTDKRLVAYSLPGRFPLTAVGFDLPQADMMAVRLLGADDPSGPYFQYASGFIYRLEQDGATVAGEAFPVTDSRRYWNLQAIGDIPFAAAPGMRVYWRAGELLFLARGKGPWTLAFGRRTAVQATALPQLARSDVLPAREIAPPAADAGTSAPPPAAQKDEDRAWILWAVLFLAVVFLSGVTVWLVRTMKK